MLDWLARTLGLLPEQTPEQAAQEATEKQAATRASNAKTVSALAWSATGAVLSALALTILHALIELRNFDKLGSAVMFSTMWGLAWYGWINPDTWLKAAKALIGRIRP